MNEAPQHLRHPEIDKIIHMEHMQNIKAGQQLVKEVNTPFIKLEECIGM